ncbi:MAG: MBOAT family protein [Lachnospiraceae bacterium]|nr:MBOAT family protein [Lachnospiraceae bacterium]
MVFSSFAFLCFFLPIIFILYYIIPSAKVRNYILMFASLVFYAYGEPVYILLLLISVFINYIFGIILDKKKSRAVLAVAVILNVSFLFVFKYLAFFIASFNMLPTGLHIPDVSISLPIGISFYTFQAISYIVDDYRGDVKGQKNFFKLLLYISFFPQLIAGPIVKYHDFEHQIDNRIADPSKIKDGIIRFSIGLSKKILIANRVGFVADKIFQTDMSNMSALGAWLGAFAYLMQIYYDFSGYSDMAIGLGKIFGFEFAENFNYPYISVGIKEFWRRWHISLSTWFKEYIYIPLGGNRKGKARTLVNKYIVFAATGIWHGANWTFLLWGLYHGTLLVIEDSLKDIRFFEKIGKNKAFRFVARIYTLLAVCIGFVLFRSDSIGQAFMMFKNMLFINTGIIKPDVVTLVSPIYIFVYIIAVIGCTGVVKKVFEKINAKTDIVLMAFSIVNLLLCYMSLASNAYNPFIYFRF